MNASRFVGNYRHSSVTDQGNVILSASPLGKASPAPVTLKTGSTSVKVTPFTITEGGKTRTIYMSPAKPGGPDSKYLSTVSSRVPSLIIIHQFEGHAFYNVVCRMIKLVNCIKTAFIRGFTVALSLMQPCKKVFLGL